MNAELKTLIDDAAKVCGGYSALARRIGQPQPNVPGMRSGKRAISPETVAALCDVLQLSGEETRRLAALAVCENPKNATKAEVLRRAFFGCWVAGAVALPPQSADAQTVHQCTTMYRRSTRKTQQPAFRKRVQQSSTRALRPHPMAWLMATLSGSTLRQGT